MLKDLRSLLYYDKYYKNEVKQISSQKTLKPLTTHVAIPINSETSQQDLGGCLANFGEGLRGGYAFLDLIVTSPMINDFDSVLKYQFIEKLVIHDNPLTDVSKLDQMLNLIDCDLSNNGIKTLPGKLNDNLLYLNLSNNEIESFIDLSKLDCLKKLNLSNNRLTRILNTSYNKSLRELDLSGNNIANLNSLGRFENLRVLRMRNCGIKSLKGIEKLTKLAVVDVSENSIKSLEPLSGLTTLKMLDIADNKINQVFEIKHIKSIKAMVSVDFRNNPFTEIRFYKHIVLHDLTFILEMDGKRLTEKEFVETEVFFGADLQEKKKIADRHLGKGNFEDNRTVHSQLKEFKDIVTEPPKLYTADFY